MERGNEAEGQAPVYFYCGEWKALKSWMYLE